MPRTDPPVAPPFHQNQHGETGWAHWVHAQVEAQWAEKVAVADLADPASTAREMLGATYAQVIGLGASNGTDDTTALNALLATAGGKIAKGMHGQSYLIAAPLVVKSGTTLDLTNCTVTLKAGSNCNMLNNTAVSTIARTSTGTGITAASNTVTGTGFTTADIGRSIVIPGAGGLGGVHSDPDGGPLCAIVTGVTSATEATVSVVAVATVAATIAPLYDRDSGITIQGGLWDRGSNPGGSPVGLGLHSIRLRRVDGLTLDNITIHTADGKFAIALGDVTAVKVLNTTFDTDSDGVHIDGPASGVIIRNCQGITGDDTVALTSCEWTPYDDVQGDISEVLIDGVQATAADAALVKIVGGTGTTIRRVTVRNLSGTATRAVSIIDDGMGVTDVGGVLIDGIDVMLADPGRTCLELTATAGKDCTAKNITFSGPSGTIGVLAGTWLLLAVENISSRDVLTECDILRVAGACGTVRLNGVRIVFSDSTMSIVVDVKTTGTVAHLTHADWDVTGGRCLYQIDGAVAQALGTNISAKSINRIVNVTAAIDLTLTNFAADTLANAAGYISGAGTLILRGSGVRRATSWAGLQRSATQVVRCTNPDYPVDVSMLAKTLGDQAYNTNTGLACGAGPVLCNGTNWKNLYTDAVY